MVGRQDTTKPPEEPPAPKPSAAVQKILDEAAQWTLAKQPQEALQAADRARMVAAQTKDWIGEAQAYRERALILQSLGRTTEALAAWREAAAAWARADDAPGSVEAQASAGLLLAAGKPAEAAQLFAQALALGKAESKRPLAVAHALTAAGRSIGDRGNLNQAREFFSAALAIQERIDPNSPAVAKSLNSLGISAWRQEKLAEAEDYHRRALAIQESLAPNSPDVAFSLHGLGLVWASRGNLSVAEDYYRRALLIREKGPPDSLDLAGNLDNLGLVLSEQGDLVAARDYIGRALAIREKRRPESQNVARTLINLGLVMYRQRDLSAARDYFQRALAIQKKLAPNSSDLATSLSNLGALASEQGDYVTATEYYQEALSIRQKLAPDSLPLAQSWGNLGTLARKQGELVAAVEHFRRALAIQEKLAPDSLDMALSLRNMGNVSFDQGDLVVSAEYYQRALAILNKTAPNSLEMARVLASLDAVAYARKDLAEAERQGRRTWDLLRYLAGTLTGDDALQGFGSLMAGFATSLVRDYVAMGKVGPAFVTLEESRAQALQRLFLERRILTHTINPELLSEYQSAIAARDRAGEAVSQAGIAEAIAQRELNSKRQEGAAPDALAKIQAALEAATKQSAEAQFTYTRARVKADDLWADIKKSAPRAFASPLNLEQAQQALPAGTLFVAFSVGEEQTHVFLLRARSSRESPLSVYTVTITYKELQALVRAFRTELTDPESGISNVVMASRTLFAKLFPKDAQAAIHGAKRLLISPDGPLWEVPFAALVMNAQGTPKYLGTDKAITYTQSLTLFAQSRADAPQLVKGRSPSAVVVGNPIFDRKTTLLASTAPASHPARGERAYLYIDGKPPAPLPATRTEAIRIAQLYGIVPLLEEDATEAALRKQIETADVIHLATHGYLHPVRAMSSGILLTVPDSEPPVGKTDNDGVLQAWEIYSQLRLKAELVVLSACETGRGQNVQGEGVIGMTRALQYAGARSIIASQWKADDQRTLTLMVLLHRHLRQGLAKDEALQRAMAHLRSYPSTAHPYYWAPFFLIGDPDNPNLGAKAPGQ
jgi:CHAT domain-containing protein/Tfp pilus assembly protein PilF